MDVLMLGNPKLREVSSNVDNFDGSLKENFQDLKDTLTYLQETKKIGRAIAAPQIGIMKNIVFFRLSDKTFYMINPKITWKSEGLINVWDSCFSFDVTFFVEIERYKAIEVEFIDQKGKKHSRKFENDLSELVQHEIDHLEGILATDHLTDVKKIILRQEWEKRYRTKE